MKIVLLALSAGILLVGCSKHDAATDSTPNSGVGAANPGVPATATTATPATSPGGLTTEKTTPDEALALVGVNNQNMPAADKYLAVHPAALAARHQVCHGMAGNQPTAALGIYCQEMEDADLIASKPAGVTNTDSL
jgi:hypothetical protein